jgi:hypothetical protein
MLKPAKTLTLAAGLCFLTAVELPAQGGLGAPPGQMGGGVRGGSAGRAPAPSGRIPEAAPPSGGGETGQVGSQPAERPERVTPSRPVGNILTPGSPGGPRSTGSSGFPGFLGQPNILSPGTPGPYRPGSVLTPGSPPASSPTGGIFVTPDRGRDRSDRVRGNRRFDANGGGAVVYPYVYFGYPYANSSYGDGGTVVRTSPNASYSIEGHLDGAAVERRYRTYQAGPGTGDEPYAETGPVDDELAGGVDEQAPGDESFDLIALQGGLIYAVHEHWLLGNTVHFVTLQGDHYVVSLPEVDLDLSVRLNRERGRKFLLEVREHDGAGTQGSTP